MRGKNFDKACQSSASGISRHPVYSMRSTLATIQRINSRLRSLQAFQRPVSLCLFVSSVQGVQIISNKVSVDDSDTFEEDERSIASYIWIITERNGVTVGAHSSSLSSIHHYHYHPPLIKIDFSVFRALNDISEL